MTMNEKKALASRIFTMELLIEECLHNPWLDKKAYENRLSEVKALYGMLIGIPWELDRDRYNNLKILGENFIREVTEE